MKNIRVFLSENFQFLEVKLSIYLNRRVFVMDSKKCIDYIKTDVNSCFLTSTYFCLDTFDRAFNI